MFSLNSVTNISEKTLQEKGSNLSPPEKGIGFDMNPMKFMSYSFEQYFSFLRQ